MDSILKFRVAETATVDPEGVEDDGEKDADFDDGKAEEWLIFFFLSLDFALALELDAAKFSPLDGEADTQQQPIPPVMLGRKWSATEAQRNSTVTKTRNCGLYLSFFNI